MTYHFKILTLLFFCGTTFSACGQNQPKGTPKVQQLSWLAGHWQGEAFGGQCEEVWSAPEGPSMMGMFKLIKENKIVFYELMTISESQGALQLQLRHFNSDLSAWEGKEEQLIFPLDHLEERKATFGKLTLERIDDQNLRITLLEKDQSGKEKPMIFNYQLKAN